MTADIQIYQIYYQRLQARYLSYAFTPYPNFGKHAPAWCEYQVFLDNYRDGNIPHGAWVGYVSWKFEGKSGVTGEDFLRFIRDSEPADVYFINPYPLQHHIYRNVWQQGEAHHPGLIRLAEQAAALVDQPIDTIGMRNGPDTAAYCNFWVANRRFWDAYMAFTLPYVQAVERLASADPLRVKALMPYFAERLFSTFLDTRRMYIRSVGYHHSAQELARYQAAFRQKIIEAGVRHNETD